MSDTSQGAGWWQASDGKWYSPEQHPSFGGQPAVETKPCRHCGERVAKEAVVCIHCGCPPDSGRHYCGNCGKPRNPEAAVCLSCGVALATDRSSSQPSPGRSLGSGVPPNNLGLAVVGLLFCLPFGIAAIIKSNQVTTLWANGDTGGAWAASEEAKKWGWLSIVVGAIVGVVWFALAAGSGYDSGY